MPHSEAVAAAGLLPASNSPHSLTLVGAGETQPTVMPRRGAPTIAFPDGRVAARMPRGVYREHYLDRRCFVVVAIACDGDSHGMRRLVPPEAGEEGLKAAEKELWAELEIIESRLLRPTLLR